MEKNEPEVHATKDNPSKVDSLSINFNTSNSGWDVTKAVEDKRNADGQPHAEQLSQIGHQKSPSISTPVKEAEYPTKEHDSSSCSCSSNCSMCKSCYNSSGSSAPVLNDNDPEDSEEEYISEEDGNSKSENDDEDIKKQKTAAQKNVTESQQENIQKQKKASQKNVIGQTDVIQKQKKAAQKILLMQTTKNFRSTVIP